MRTIRETLAEHPLFSGLAATTLDLLAGCARNERIPAGTQIYRAGSPAVHFHLIREGRVALGLAAPQAGMITIETLGPGDMLGWSWLFPPYRWHFDVEALEPLATISFDGVCLLAKCDADPALGYLLTRRFSALLDERLRATQLRLLDVYREVPID